jgi:hypothetical protein
MRRPNIILSLALISAVLVGFLLAPAAFAKKHPAAPSAAKTQIVTDQKTNSVYILINGKKVVTIDAKGLHVSGDVDYTGTITDK